MAPKAKKKRGLLGMAVDDSEDDEDYNPGDDRDYEHLEDCSKKKRKARTSPLDVPILIRLSQLAANRAGAQGSRARAAPAASRPAAAATTTTSKPAAPRRPAAQPQPAPGTSRQHSAAQPAAAVQPAARGQAAGPSRPSGGSGGGGQGGPAASRPAAAAVTAPSRPCPSLPGDVLAAIFGRACAKEALPAAAAVTCVCRQWRDVARGLPSLWSQLDLEVHHVNLTRKRPAVLTDALVATLVRRGVWREVTHVRFTEHKGLSDVALLTLAQGCRSLTSLDLTGCQQLRQEKVEAALQAMVSLTSLDLSQCGIHPRGSGLDSVIRTVLTPRPGRVSCGLQKLVASGCPYLSRAVMQAFLGPPKATAAGAGSSSSAQLATSASSTPHLLELRHVDLSGSGTTEGRHQLHPEKLQAAAPHLEVLNVTALGGVFGWDVSFQGTPSQGAPAQADPPRGWPNLQVLELGAAELYSATGHRVCFSCLTNPLLLRLAGGSPLLHTLDLSGCAQYMLTPVVLEQLPCREALKVLRLRRSTLGNDVGLKIAAECFKCLEVVDVSGNGGAVSDEGVIALALACPRLTALELMGSAVTEQGVRSLLLHCPALDALDVRSCRSLTRSLRMAAQTTDVAAIKQALEQGQE